MKKVAIALIALITTSSVLAHHSHERERRRNQHRREADHRRHHRDHHHDDYADGVADGMFLSSLFALTSGDLKMDRNAEMLKSEATLALASFDGENLDMGPELEMIVEELQTGDETPVDVLEKIIEVL